MHFTVDIIATIILLISLGLFWWIRTFLASSNHTPSLAFSRLQDLKLSSWRSRHASLPQKLYFFALACLMIAFIDPHFLFQKSPFSHEEAALSGKIATQGIAIYLVLDQSGSMTQSVEAANAEGVTRSIPKINLLKEVTKEFILAHPSDLLGLVSFARIPRVLVPLTLDHETLLKHLAQLQVVKNPDEDGTAIGYAIYKTASILAATRSFAEDVSQNSSPPYTIKSAVIIVVTDGFQDPSRLDRENRLRTMELDDAAAYAKSQKIKVYVVNIDPALATAQYAPQRRQLEKITALTGGHFYLTGDTLQLQNIYDAIDRLEKGTITQEASVKPLDSKSDYSRFSLFPFFLWLGLGALCLSQLLSLTLFRRVP
jgi:Ca-activated chloride channel family protein